MTVESILDAPRSPTATKHLNPLTGIRIFAAIAIVEGHSWAFWKPSLLLGLTLNHGVSVFFVLSGFILAYSYPSYSDVTRRHFFLARFARVWPMHMFATVVLFLLVPTVNEEFSKPGELFTIIHYVTLTQSWFPTWQNFLSFNGVAWSISVELFFYLSFPLWILNWGRFTWLKLPASLAPAILLIDYGNMIGLSEESWAPGMTMYGLIHFFPLARLPEFVFGVVVGAYWTKHRFELNWWTSIAAELIAVLAMFLALKYTWFIAADPDVAKFLGPAGTFWLVQNGFTPVFAAFIFIMASSTGPAAKFLGWKPMVILGEVSFAVYLLHSILLRYYQSFPDLISRDPGVWRLLYWAGVLAMSYLAFELIETPARAKITSKSVKPTISSRPVRIGLLTSAAGVAALAIVAPTLH